MRIDYTVLWFENDDDWLEPYKENLTNHLAESGFRLNAEIFKDGNQLDTLLSEINQKKRDVDLILMDYKLSSNDKGNELIERIRQTELFTEIVFYSQGDNVKQVIEAEHKSIEGIYYASRDTFLQKTKEVIWHTIKKVEDIESMRGLIMGVFSETESLMVEIILTYIDKCSAEVKQKISAPIFDYVSKALSEKSTKFSEYHPELKLHKLIKDNVMFDADKKAFALQMIIDELGHSDLLHLSDQKFHDIFKKNLAVRNKFGHAKVIVENGIRKLFHHESPEEFTDIRCVEIRKQLILQLDNVKRIRASLPS